MRLLGKMEYKLPKREQNSNKGTFGKILNIAGSHYMTGAAYLSSISALRVGAGYVVLASDEDVLNKIPASEIVLAPFEKIPEFVNEITVISIGCGLSTSNKAKKIFEETINLRKNLPTVIDADGLNILAQRGLKLDKNTILTPHPKEASRLLKCTLEDVLNSMEDCAKEICKKYNCVTVLKSHKTIVTDGNSVYKNTTGCSALAKAGSGDVLCGIISGLLAQKMLPFEAAILGVYIHGLCGDLAAKDLSEYSVLASDLLKYMPFAIKSLLAENI
jgi:NAD(P)H-hydrate epimerase